MPTSLLPEINIDALLNISQPKAVEPEIAAREIELMEPSQAAAVFDISNIHSNVATPGNSPFVSAAMVQQYRNTEIMQTNSKENIQKDGSREDYDVDDPSRIEDLHVRDMVRCSNLYRSSIPNNVVNDSLRTT